MAQDNQVLIDIVISNEKAVQEIVDARKNIEELKRSQENLTKAVNDGSITEQEYAAKMTATKVAIQANTKEIQANEKELRNNIKAQTQNDNSLNAMRANLSILTKEYDNLSKAERTNAETGGKLLKDISDLTNELKAAEEETGRFQRNVGNYGDATRNLKAELKSLVSEIANMKIAGKENSEEYAKLVSQAGEIKDAIGDAGEAISNSASDTDKLDGAIQQLGAGISVFTAGSNALKLFGVESETLNVTMSRMTAIMATLNSLKTIQVAVQKQSAASQFVENTARKLGIDLSLKQAKAEASMNIIKGKGSIATKAVAAAQWLWNTALYANPVIAIATAIAALIAGIIWLTRSMSENTQATKAAEKENDKYNDTVKRSEEIIRQVTEASKERTDKITNDLRREILALKEQGGKEKEIAEARIAAEKKIAQEKINTSKEIQRQTNIQIVAIFKVIDAEKATLATLKAGSKEYKEQQEKIDGLIKSKNAFIKTVNDEQQAQENLIISGEEDAQKAREEATKKEKERLEKVRQERKKALETEAALIAQFNKQTTELIENEQKRQTQAAKDASAKIILDLQTRLKTEKNLTQTSRKTIANLIIQEQQILNKNLKEIDDKFDVERESARLANLVAANTKESEERTILLRAQLALELAEELKNAEKRGLDTESIRAKYATQDFELTKSLALAKYNALKEIADNEFAQRKLDLQARYASDVEQAELDLERARFEQELLLSLDAETKAAMFESDAAYTAQVIASKERVMDAERTVIKTQREGVHAQLQAIGIIQGAFSDMMETFAGDNEEMQGFSKAMALATIAINTATAISGAIAQAQTVGFPGNIIAIATGIAAVMSGIASAYTTLNKAKSVKAPKFAQGGIVSGPGTSTSDSVPAMLSSGESVINAASTKAFAPLLSAINEAGGGQSFVGNLTSQIASEDALAKAFALGVSMLPAPQVAITDILDATNRVNAIETESSYENYYNQ